MSAILAKALNSTLGKKNFASFDKLLAYKSVTASDAHLVTIGDVQGKTVTVLGDYNGTGDSTSEPWVSADVLSFRLGVSGTVKMSFTCKFDTNDLGSGSAIASQAQVSLIKNGDQKNPIVTGTFYSSQADEHVVTWNAVPIDVNDVFIIRLAIRKENPERSSWSNLTVTTPLTVSATKSEYVSMEVL